MMEKNNNNRMLILTISDRKEFLVSEAVARESQKICRMIEDDQTITKIPLPNIKDEILKMVLRYCKKLAEEKENVGDVEAPTTNGAGSSFTALPAPEMSNTDMKEWNKEFVKDLDDNMLGDLFLASFYLHVEGLVHLTSQSTFDIMKRKILEECRDFTPKEEAGIQHQDLPALE